jgi:hypothetical protein
MAQFISLFLTLWLALQSGRSRSCMKIIPGGKPARQLGSSVMLGILIQWDPDFRWI